MEIKIKKCPYCGSDGGFQTEAKCRGTYLRNITFKGEDEYSQYGDGMNYGKESTPRCIDCGKPLGRWIKL